MFHPEGESFLEFAIKLEEQEEKAIPPAITATSPQVFTGGRRAHVRLSWQERLAHNRTMSMGARFRIALFGVAPCIAAYLNLTLRSPGE